MIIQNVKIINVSNRTFFVTILACILLLYLFYLFNSCLLSSINKAIRRVRKYLVLPIVQFPWEVRPGCYATQSHEHHFRLQSSSVSHINTSAATSSNSNDVTQIIFGSVVRIVSLTDDDNRNESAFKYRLVNPQNLSARRLPDVLLIGVKKSGTRALLEFIRVHPDGKLLLSNN